MKIVHVSPSYARRDGGPSEVLRQLVPELIKQGHSVELVTTDKAETVADRADVESLHAKVAHAARHPRGMNFATRLLPSLREAIRLADVVHVHSVSTYVSSVAVALSRHHGKPVFLQPHGALTHYQRQHATRSRRAWDFTIDRRLLRRAHTIVVSSDLEADQLPGPYRTLVAPLGVDRHLLTSTRAVDRENPFILFLGRVTNKKRLDILLEALALPELSGISLKVAGPLAPDLQWDPFERIANLGLAGRVELLGEVGPPARKSLLASASLFALLSDDESFGIAAAEALAAGCPTVISTFVGLAPPSLASQALPPFIICPQSASEFAKVGQQVLRNQQYASDIAREGRNFAAVSFSWERVAQTLTHAYEGAL